MIIYRHTSPASMNGIRSKSPAAAFNKPVKSQNATDSQNDKVSLTSESVAD